MRILFVLVSFYVFCGCVSRVHVSLNSIASPSLDSKILRFSFIRDSTEIEDEKLLQQCELGGVAAGKIIIKECAKDCLLVDVEGQTGQSREKTNSYYDAYTKTNKVYSHTETDRKMRLKMFEPQDLSKAAYQVLIDSSGSGRSVLSVASEMCEAAFKVFPEDVTDKEMKIKAR